LSFTIPPVSVECELLILSGLALDLEVQCQDLISRAVVKVLVVNLSPLVRSWWQDWILFYIYCNLAITVLQGEMW